MKLLSAQQIHEWDSYTIEHEPITSLDLMERAARECTRFILDRQLITSGVKIFCGKGNNGGDGLAVARQLIEAGIQPYVYILEFGAKGTDDFQTNLARLHPLTGNIHFMQSADFFPIFQPGDLVIDALYGSGLNRPLRDLSKQLVDHINDSGVAVVSIDVPSGMFIDKTSKGCAVISAAHTLTFQSLKLCFLVAENASNFGEVHVLDIGLLAAYTENTDAHEILTLRTIKSNYKKRKAFDHKGNFGHSLIIAGNKGKMGAAIMAAKACLRTGAGLVTVGTDECLFNIVHATVPEAMCLNRGDSGEHTRYTTIGMGPGMGTGDEEAEIVLRTLENFKAPVVIDADALTIISRHTDWLEKIPPGSVLTPHPKEFERLFGKSNDDFERISHVLRLTASYPFIIVLKGHFTLVAAGGKAYFNPTGNPGMAKGGSGDVLTGMLTALLSQGYSPLAAATTGVYLHGLSADITSQSLALESMLAEDIIEHISDAFLQLS